MILELKVTDDQGQVVAYASGPVEQPVQIKMPPGKPLVVVRNGRNNGAYLVSTITSQPICVLDLNYGRVGERIEPNPNPLSSGLQHSTGNPNQSVNGQTPNQLRYAETQRLPEPTNYNGPGAVQHPSWPASVKPPGGSRNL